MSSVNPKRLSERLRSILERGHRPPQEHGRLIELMVLFARLGPPPDPHGLYPDYADHRERFLESAEGRDSDLIEERFLELYCHLHGSEAPYTNSERARVTETGGYWCHAGGLSPVLKAEPWIWKDTRSCDLGAGNGLQMLLVQKLFPHARTVQFEISSRMVETGRTIQKWLGVPEDRVEWVTGDLVNVSVKGMDFIYLYRPLKPTFAGREFYERFAAEVAEAKRPVVIFSIADCLRPFLPGEFEVFYTDGQLTCYRFDPR